MYTYIIWKKNKTSPFYLEDKYFPTEKIKKNMWLIIRFFFLSRSLIYIFDNK